jgi:DNA-binding winged helix-turn-helix (wHTH) protein
MKIRFEPFEVDTTSGRLLKHGIRVPLREQAFQVLMALLDRPGELVTRAELRKRLWRDATTVDFEAGLNAAISRLRGALNDQPESPRFIETLPKRGYRFLAAVPRQPSVAVLPIESAIDDEEGEQIANGLTEELIRILGRIEGVRVASRSAVSCYKPSSTIR